MPIISKQLLDNPKFESLVEQVENEDGSHVYSTSHVFHRIANRLDDEFDLSPYSLEELELKHMQDFVCNEFQESNLSPRFKKQMQDAIMALTDVDDLLMWLAHHATEVYYKG